MAKFGFTSPDGPDENLMKTALSVFALAFDYFAHVQ